MNKNSRQKFKYFENEKSFSGEIKSILYHFKKAFIEGKNNPIFIRKVTPTQVFSSVFCEIFMNTFFAENLRTNASEVEFEVKLQNCSF